MKILFIFALISLSVIVRGTWWAAAVKPVILGFGAAFAAVDLDLQSDLFLKFPFFSDLLDWMLGIEHLKVKEIKEIEEEIEVEVAKTE